MDALIPCSSLNFTSNFDGVPTSAVTHDSIKYINEASASCIDPKTNYQMQGIYAKLDYKAVIIDIDRCVD